MKKLSCGAAVLFSLFVATTQAAEPPGPQKLAILTTITETVLATVSLIQDENNGKIENVLWSADYSNQDWRLRISTELNGQRSVLYVTGHLWGAEKENWLVT